MKRKLTGICCLLILLGGIALLIAGIVVGNTFLLFAGIGITAGSSARSSRLSSNACACTTVGKILRWKKTMCPRTNA